MTALINELKTRARLQLNAMGGKGASGGPRLKDCLNKVSRDAGFMNWDHARRVLGGEAVPRDDMGRFWHAPGCDKLLNQWFADLAQARAVHAGERGSFLLPYGRQFVVAQDDYVRELGMDPAEPAWTAMGRDLVRGYGSAAWVLLAMQRLVALRGNDARRATSARAPSA